MAGRKPYEPDEAARATAREMSGAGRTRSEIAAALGISVPTLAKKLGDCLQWPVKDDAPLLSHVGDKPAPQPPRRAGGTSGGRPAFAPTLEQRRDVELYLADGWSKSEIAHVLNISVATLEKHFVEELTRGALKARADNLKRLRGAAASGSVSAMNELQARFDAAESAARAPREVAPEKPREDTPGKKVQAGRAAHEAATTGSWADVLGDGAKLN